MHHKKHIKNNAFTLVEMAIVIVVIGLIAGVIAIGESMVYNANLQSITADIDIHKKAAQLFKDKYGELPGDYSTATTHWGAEAACPVGATTPHVTTCNGGGDGFIGNTTNTLTALTTTNNAHRETLRVWQHLSNAGFIQNAYSGYQNASGTIELGVNTPSSKIEDATYLMFYVPKLSTDSTSSFASDYGHVIVFGKASTAVTMPPYSAVISSADALSIDKKIDDGAPGYGKVLAYTTGVTSPTPSCTTNANTYNIATNGVLCSLIFITGF